MQKGKQHRNISGKSSILDVDQELGEFVLSRYMEGLTPTLIEREIIIKYPDKKISRITIDRWISKKITEELDPESLNEETASKELLKSFDDTINNFNLLFDELKETLNLDSSQIDKINKMHKRTILNLNNCKKKWQIFKLQCKINDTELKDMLSEFCRELSGEQKRRLNEIVEQMLPPDQVFIDANRKKYDKFNRAKTKLWFKHFPQHENTEVQ